MAKWEDVAGTMVSDIVWFLRIALATFESSSKSMRELRQNLLQLADGERLRIDRNRVLSETWITVRGMLGTLEPNEHRSGHMFPKASLVVLANFVGADLKEPHSSRYPWCEMRKWLLNHMDEIRKVSGKKKRRRRVEGRNVRRNVGRAMRRADEFDSTSSDDSDSSDISDDLNEDPSFVAYGGDNTRPGPGQVETRSVTTLRERPTCPITFEPILHFGATDCCARVFEFDKLARAVRKHPQNACPWCRSKPCTFRKLHTS
jgi:hypothetical protein